MKIKRSWIVRINCETTKEVITDECTEDEATKDPWHHATDERELDQLNWSVVEVKPND